MAIQFGEIALQLTPGAFMEIDNTGAVEGLAADRPRVLLLGIRQSTGTVAKEILTPITSESQGWGYFGAGSQLGQMCFWAKRANPAAEIYALALDADAAGTAATATITVTGPATADGTIVLYAGGVRIKVAVVSGDTDEEIAAAINTAIGAEPYVPATSTVLAEVVTATCRWKGASGNFLAIGHSYGDGEALPAGVGLTITAFSSGATDPDVADAIAVMGDDKFSTVVMPWTDDTNMDLLEAEMASRYTAARSIEGMIFAAVRDTYANAQTYGNARNSPHSHVLDTAISLTPPWLWAASWAAIEAGYTDPAIPRQNKLIPYLLVPKLTADQRTRPEREALLADGMSSYTVVAGQVSIERCVTTYQLNGGGIADTSYRNLETMRCIHYFRFTWRVWMATRYPAAKLASDDFEGDPGQQVMTPLVGRAECIGHYSALARAAIVEDEAGYAETLVVERNESDPDRLDFFMRPNWVNQLRVMAAKASFKN